MEFIRKHKKLLAMIFAVVVMSTMAFSAFASNDSGSSSSINNAVSSGLQTVQSDALSLIGTIIPYALAVMGAVLVVMIGIKVFKGIAKK